MYASCDETSQAICRYEFGLQAGPNVDYKTTLRLRRARETRNRDVLRVWPPARTRLVSAHGIPSGQELS